MKYILFSVILLISLGSLSQPAYDSLPKRYRHELGADITGLIKQFMMYNNNGQLSSNPYVPIYYVTYRYHFKKANIRFGIGGEYSQSSVPGYAINGQEKTFTRTFSGFSARIGYERTSELSKRWQAFYGIDFRPTISKDHNQAQFSNAGYINGYITESTTYGLAPLLGFRFRLTSRVSLTTELSFTAYYGESSRQSTYISQDDRLYPPIPDGQKMISKTISASFSQPTFLTLAVDL
jgi:hypothetical protein